MKGRVPKKNNAHTFEKKEHSILIMNNVFHKNRQYNNQAAIWFDPVDCSIFMRCPALFLYI
jgi:hypothetical protein